jgi:hypothetical protein
MIGTTRFSLINARKSLRDFFVHLGSRFTPVKGRSLMGADYDNFDKFKISKNVRMSVRVSHQKHIVQFSWGLSAITELQTPTKLYKKESVRLEKISDLQRVIKDFTVSV